ncbi:transposase [Paraglaciecola aquimarina]|uniref:Transposase n=1 Tax=Paraglaciecola aquimarina TaxID=1235557 RepID=A0ABU3T034_9ALTE|nr:transposase [Paraglaciecola aquimarina]MDU0354308.1 transposase [Paraglaciecola aquimarina]MDU0355627.1 transposase [Paraglaciecola aquimarina]
MTQKRASLISLSDTPFYHCVSRCVRRSFLCGVDHYSGQNYEHRRAWVEERLLFLSSVFAIDICAYAVMSNHVHVVLHVDVDKALNWSNKQVLALWHTLYKGTLLTQRFMRDDELTKSEMHTLEDTIAVYRQRLHDISWLMRNLNEHIAREANKEDECTGRFWEGRFKSQALLDNRALLACMAYVDLNPIRTKIATTPENSHHTSIQKRIHALKTNQHPPHTLLPFVGNPRQNMPKGISFSLKDYCELVDITGRVIREDKQGHIATTQPAILQRLGLSDAQWLTLTTEFEQHFCYAVGSEHMMRQFAEHTGHQRMRGMCTSKTLLKRA